MKSFLIGSAASVLVVGFAMAQTTPNRPAGTGTVTPPSTSGVAAQPLPPTGNVATPGTSVGAPSNATPGNLHNDGGKAAASGNTNQAVATTNANANQPAKGANSFTEAEARRRIEANGFSNVTGLAKDADGVWRGKAQQKGGGSAEVWLDYKGNAGLKM